MIERRCATLAAFALTAPIRAACFRAAGAVYDQPVNYARASFAIALFWACSVPPPPELSDP
jgi:hypothetical protein